MHVRRIGLVVAAAVCAVCATAFAQPPGATPPMQPQGPAAQPAGQAGPAAGGKGDKVKEQIRRMRDFDIANQLALDQATNGRLVAVMGRFDDEFDKLIARRIELQGKLNNADKLKDPEIEHLIDDAIGNQRQFRDVEERRLAELRKLLTPQQAARLIVFLPQEERRIQNQLQRAIKNAAAGTGPGAGNKRRPKPQRQDDDDE